MAAPVPEITDTPSYFWIDWCIDYISKKETSSTVFKNYKLP
jgi:hypothetical protein